MLVEKLYPSTLIETNLYGLSLVESACQMLRNGPVSINDLWPGQLNKPALPPLNLYVDMEAKEELLNLRKAHCALKRLQSSLDAKIGLMERSIKPAILHVGIHSLPNEVLERILYEAWDRENSYSTEKSLARLESVNTRFRALCLHSSKMDKIRNDDYRMRFCSVRTICEKSPERLQKVTTLEVGISLMNEDDVKRGGMDIAKLPAAIASCDRLQHLKVKIRIFHLDYSAFKDARRLQLQTRSTLPNVESFAFLVSVYGENEEVSKALTSLFLSLRMPRLVDLNFTVNQSGLWSPWNEIFPFDHSHTRIRNLSLHHFPFTMPPGERQLKWPWEGPCNPLLPGLLERLPNTQSLTTCLEKMSHDCHGLAALAALAKLRELTLIDCRMSQDELEAFLRALFEQEEVNLERITIHPAATYKERNGRKFMEVIKTVRSPIFPPSFWTDKLRGNLKNDFVVEFT